MMLLTMSMSAKTLVVYYSYTNNCHEIVTTLTSQIEADVMRMNDAREIEGNAELQEAYELGKNI